MAYKSNSLSVTWYADGITSWLYHSEERCRDVARHDFFAPAHKMLRVGDMIYVAASNGAILGTVRKSAPSEVSIGWMVAFEDAPEIADAELRADEKLDAAESAAVLAATRGVHAEAAR